MWGGQSCLQPAFRPAGPAEKRVRRLESLPHKLAPLLLYLFQLAFEQGYVLFLFGG